MDKISNNIATKNHKNMYSESGIFKLRKQLQSLALGFILITTGCKEKPDYNFVTVEANSLGNGRFKFTLIDPKTNNKEAHFSYISEDSIERGDFEVAEGNEEYYNQAFMDTTGKMFYWKLSLHENGKNENGQTWEAQVPETDARQFHMTNGNFDQNSWVFPIEMD